MDETSMHFPMPETVSACWDWLWPQYLPEATLHIVNSYHKERCLFGVDTWLQAIRPVVQLLFFKNNESRCLFGYRLD